MKYIVIVLLLTIVYGPQSAFSQSPTRQEHSNKFKSIDDAARATFSYLSKTDTNSYCNVVDLDCFLEFLKKQSGKDSTLTDFYLKVTNDRGLICKIFISQLSDFMKSLTQHFGQIKSFEYTGSKIKSTHVEQFTTDYTVGIEALVNKKECNITIHVAEYKKGYYIFEPVEGFH